MRLHGHTRLELTDIHTGAVEVVEKDNIITNAVGEIFNGYGGSLNKAMLLWRGQQDDPNAPKDLVTMFYGGLLLYDSPLGADPATRFAPAAAGITGTAIAGLVNATTNTTRGSANLTETKLDPAGGTMTYVYEFATNQGNGVIQSVCLTQPQGAYYSEMIDAPNASPVMAGRLSFGGALGGDQLLTGLLAKDCYPTGERGVLLYADPAADEALAGRVDTARGVLELRRHCLGLRTLDLFRRDTQGGWDSLVATDTVDISGFLQSVSSNAGRYCRLCFDAEADKLYLIAAPEGSTIAAGGIIRVREYDRKTLAARDYTVPNNTGGALRAAVSEAKSTPLNGTVYGGSLYMTAPSTYQIYRFPLADPTDVQAVTMHGDTLQYLSDAHDASKDCPSFGGVYKLAAIMDRHTGKFIPKIKLSENTEKVTNPGNKTIQRIYDKETGKIIADLICLVDEEFDEKNSLLLFDPIETWKKTHLAPGTYTMRELLVPIFKNGECVYESPKVMDIREYCKKEQETLWDESRRLVNPHEIHVDLSNELWHMKAQLLDSYHYTSN